LGEFLELLSNILKSAITFVPTNFQFVIIHTSFDTFKNVRNPIVTIGTFDGVHLGHGTILNKLKEIANEVGGETVLLTFYPHPRMVLYPDDHGLELLTSQEEKADLLKQFGLDHLVILPFTAEFSRKPAFEYVRDLLVSGMQTHTLVIGYDHRFGRNREGNHATLVDLSDSFGYRVVEIPAQQIDAAEISSTKIRKALQIGDVEMAQKLLGYHYTISGTVVTGDGRGRTIGFPTANIQANFAYKLIPFNGVYAARCVVDNLEYNAVINIGIRPTFHEGSERKIEAHILDFSGDLYNKSISLRFVSRIRSEQKFGSIVELTEQIKTDIAIALNHLA
jgi:riboflavin kinase / FMN adenylyltransferase